MVSGDSILACAHLWKSSATPPLSACIMYMNGYVCYDRDHPVSEVKPIRNKVCDLLQINVPVALKVNIHCHVTVTCR